jgi:leucyl/phenylalanyl-tRNA---protein transferase
MITPALLLRAYAAGVFPMAESRDDPKLHWMEPQRRGIFPINGFHISRSLRAQILRANYQITVNRNFAAVLAGCADRPSSWINGQISALYLDLHEMGYAHSLEVWHDEALIGGVYGVHLGAAFFGESMFSRATGGSKLALAYLMHRLHAGGFQLFDTQYLTPHLASLGAIEISKSEYQARLATAIHQRGDFTPPDYCPEPASVVGTGSNTGKAKSGTSQRITQTS